MTATIPAVLAAWQADAMLSRTLGPLTIAVPGLDVPGASLLSIFDVGITLKPGKYELRTAFIRALHPTSR